MLERKRYRTKTMVCTALLLAACLAGAAAANQRAGAPAATPSATPGDLTRLADGVFVRIVSPDSDAVSNGGVIVLESGVLLFDTYYTPEAAGALAEKLKAVTPRPVRYIVNSHFHPDHTHGNQVFPAARQVIAATAARRDMLQRDLPALNQVQNIARTQVEQLSKELGMEPDVKRRETLRGQLNARQAFLQSMSALKIVAPSMTVDDSLSIRDGGREVRLLYLGAGHTDGDLILFLPQEKIVFLGDLFFNASLPNAEDATFLEWTKTLGEALKLDAATFVPGHGQVGTRRDVEDFLTYLKDLKELVAPAVKRGDTLERVVADLHLPAKYASLGFQNFFPANLQRMYAELKALETAAQQRDGVKKEGMLP